MRVAGFGFRAAATAQSLCAALDAAGGARGLTAVATAQDKAAAAAMVGLADLLHLPILPVALPALRATPATPSPAVPARYGRQSLAEASALAAAGPGARLIARRAVSPCGLATCAIAERTTS